MENLKEISKLVHEFRQRKIKNLTSLHKNKTIIEKKIGKVPPPFSGNSNLFIRSFEGDVGIRPIPIELDSINPPDIKIFEIDHPNVNVSILQIGKKYRISCIGFNSGDLVVPSAKFEFFLFNKWHWVDPFGQNDTNIPNINDYTKIGLTACWINPMDQSTVNIDFTPDVSHLTAFFGFIIIRVFSFSPMDLPQNINELNSRNDKHTCAKIISIKN